MCVCVCVCVCVRTKNLKCVFVTNQDKNLYNDGYETGIYKEKVIYEDDVPTFQNAYKT